MLGGKPSEHGYFEQAGAAVIARLEPGITGPPGKEMVSVSELKVKSRKYPFNLAGPVGKACV
jgi:hypothetical protein